MPYRNQAPLEKALTRTLDNSLGMNIGKDLGGSLDS